MSPELRASGTSPSPPITSLTTGRGDDLPVRWRMKLRIAPSLRALGQDLQGLTSWFTFLTHLNIVELVTFAVRMNSIG